MGGVSSANPHRLLRRRPRRTRLFETKQPTTSHNLSCQTDVSMHIKRRYERNDNQT